MQRVLTVCPHCSCGCGLYLLVDREEVIGVVPSPGHAVSRGSLCFKGWTSFQHLRHPGRLSFPRIRLNGTLTRVSWEQAFSYLIERLEAVRLEHGGQAIGLWASGRATNEELHLLRRIASQALETEAVCFDPSLHTLDHIPASFLEGPKAARFDEIQAADLLVIFGQSVEEHHPQVASRILKAMDRGAKGVVISPRQDLLARRATLHLQLPVGEDFVARITGEGEGSFESLRTMWGDARQPLVIYPLKSLSVFSEINLLKAFEGLLAKTSAKVLLLFPRANSRGAFRHRQEPRDLAAPKLKALLVVEEDPASWNTASREMVQNLEFVVVLDFLHTETVELAHVVLPSAGFAEKDGTLINTEGRQQELRSAVPPPGEAKAGWLILAELARRLGIRDVGSTLEEIQRAWTPEHTAPVAIDREPGLAAIAATGHSNFQHVPDRLGWMWLKDTVLSHTDDWQREHQDRWIEIHPEDAKQLGLRPGWMVRVTGEGGEFHGVARASERASRGVLVSPYDLFEGPVQLERAG